MKKRVDKKAIGMSFNWIFAIIAGAFILFLAIFVSSNFIKTSEKVIYTETAASLISFFDPLETGLASGKAHEIRFKKRSKVFFDCEEELNPPFGKQTISFSEQTFSEEYGERGERVSIKNKYIFVQEVVEGETFYIFSKPFFMPFKITDLIIVTSADDNYCFYNSPKDIKESLEGLNLENIHFPNETSECKGMDVCFGDQRTGCQIKVYEDQGYVLNRKYGKRVYYVGDLIYGAIFSTPDIYECNVKRIKSRFDQLAGIYIDKIEVIERKDCSSNVGAKLASVLGKLQDSRELIGLYNEIQDIDSINKLAKSGCQLYYNKNFGI